MGTHCNNPSSNLRSRPASFSQYVSVRQRLDDLGYNYYLSNDTVLLVDKLLSDLLHYKEQCSVSQQNSSSSLKQRNELGILENGIKTAEFCNNGDNQTDGQNSHPEYFTNRNVESQIEELKLENKKLNEAISELKFVLNQNSSIILKLKKENDSKALMILQLQNELSAGEAEHTASRPYIQKDGELPNANIAKIQALYKRILSASDNPAIIDWVKAAEIKISNLERELENTYRALDVSQQSCEEYQKKIFEYEKKLTQLDKGDKNKLTQNYSQLKSRMEEKELQIKDLQVQLSEAIRKQHEAMSRAIMLAGDRPHHREVLAKQAGAEKKVVSLESERNVLKQMLTSTQKERDELMKEVHRLHSQESSLMNEIRELVSDGSTVQGSKSKNVRFQCNSKAKKLPVDSGVESAASSAREEGGGRNRENWLKRLTEQRQSYYDNVNQLLNYMKNRHDLPLSAVEQRSNSQQSNSALSATPDPKPSFPQANPYQPTLLQQPPYQGNFFGPNQFQLPSQVNVEQPPNVLQTGSTVSSSNISRQPVRLSNQPTVTHQPSSQSNRRFPNPLLSSPRNQPSVSQPTISRQNLAQNVPLQTNAPEFEQNKDSSKVLPLPPSQTLNSYQNPPLSNLQQPGQQPAYSDHMYNPQPTLAQSYIQNPAQFQTSTNGNQSQYQPFAQFNPPWNAQSQGYVRQMNPMYQTAPTCLCGGQSLYLSQPNVPSTYQQNYQSSQAYQSQPNFDQQQFLVQQPIQNQMQRPEIMLSSGTQTMGSSSDQLGHERMDQLGNAINVQDRRTQTKSGSKPDYTPSTEELNKLPSDIQSWAEDIIEEKRKLKEKNTELRLELDTIAENSQKTEEKAGETSEKLKKAEDMINKLKTDLESANNKTRNLEQGLQVERNNLQQLRLDIDAADGNASSLTKKYVEKSTQLDSAKQLCSLLEQNVASLEDQVTSLQNQLQALQSQNQKPNPAVQKLLEEVESRNARIIQLDKQLSSKQQLLNQRENELEAVTSKMKQFEQDLGSETTKLQQLQQDLDNTNNKLKAAERELAFERTKLQQLQLDITNADSNAASLAKKMMEKSGLLDAAKQRCAELEDRVSKLDDQVGALQGQVRNLQVLKANGETDKRQLEDELDSLKARTMQLERQTVTKQETISMLQTTIQTYESKIQTLEREIGEKSSQVEVARRANDRNNLEIDKANFDNAAIRQENERLVASIAQTRMELDRERQGTEDLRREIQSYINQVRQVEAILARKDEEKDALLKQFQQLANETNNFDAERESMERSIRNQQLEVATLQAELTTVRRRLGELEQLYSHQKSASVQAEIQAEDLMRRLGILERDLRDARGDKIRLEQQVAAAHDLQSRLEKQLEKLRVEAAQVDSTNHQMETETTRLHEDLHVLEQRLSKEREAVRNLESIISILRQERSQQETQMRTMSQDLTRLHHREILLQEELANTKAELCATEGKVADVTRENQRLKQEVLQEKFEREKSRQELRRLGHLSHTPPLLPSCNVSPAPPGALHNLSAASNCTPTFTNPGGMSLPTTSPRKKMTIAARFANSGTQT